MREIKTGLALLVALLCLSALVSCKEPTKPIKKLNIKRASDYEPIAPPPGTVGAEPEVEPQAEPPGEAMEIVEVQGFRGDCDSTFVGINTDDLVTMRTASQVRTVRLAGISIPEDVKLMAQNQIRIWLDRKSVGVEIDESLVGLDPAVYLWTCPGGTMINEELVRDGLAVPARGPARRSDALKKASVEALTAGRGVWGKKAE
jgi:endonuclease YncB( thermonuclease family)